ncbi:unnamed protein product [Closterium sp. NIES-53]
MASLRVLTFNHEGRPIQFDTWLDDLQLYLLSNSRDSVSLFDHTSGVAPAPPAIAESETRSQWLTRDAAARLAIRDHLPLAECTHFGQHRTAQALYNAVVARYTSPATAALGRLMLPYLFPELSTFATVEDLVTHLRTSNARYRTALPAEFLDRNPPPIYFIVTRLPNSLRFVRDHFLALDPTALAVDLLEQHLLAVETSVVAVGAARGTPRTPFFEGCSPSPLAPSYASAAAVDVLGAEDVGAASTSGKRRSSKGKGGRGGGGGSGGGGSGGSGSGGGRAGATQRGEFDDEVECPRWAELLWSGVAIFDLDYDTILAAMYALSVSAEGDCYLCVPPDPGIEAAALGASESVLPGTAPAEALHTFTLDSGASRCFFRDSTTLTPLSAPVPVRLADPSGGPVLAHSSSVLPCLAVPSGSLSSLHLPSFSTNLVSTAALQDAMVTTTNPGGQRVSICTCTQTGRHLATFKPRPGSSLYTLATEPPHVAASAQVSASGPVAPPCSCRLLSHQTLLWHHRLGHPSLPRLCGMHSRLLHAAPHSSSFPPTTAPLQTLHMDVWGPTRVSGQGRERYFLLVVDDYTRYTTVFPLYSKGQVIDVLIPWIRAVRLQLRERIRQDLLVLRLHFDRGGEFSSDLLRDFCRGKGILQSFTLPDSPQQNGIAERRIGLVMEVARTSMIHAAAPHFLWPFAVRYAAHQLNLWPRVSLPDTSPTQRWPGEVCDASVFRVWGSRAFVRDTSADKLSARAIPCVFLGFPPDAPSWQFYHPTSRRVFPSQDITFDESVPFYRVSQVDPLPGTVPVEVAVDTGTARGAASGGAKPEGAEPGGAEPGGAESEGAGSGGVEPGGAESRVLPSSGGGAGALPQLSPRPEPLSPQQLREWLTQCTRFRSGATGAGDPAAGDTGAGFAGGTAGAGGTGGAPAAGPGGPCTRGTGAARTGGVGGAGARDPTKPAATGAGGVGAGGARVVGAGAGGTGVGGVGPGGAGAVDLGARGAGAGGAGGTGAGGTMRPRSYFVPLLQPVLGVPSSTGLPPPLLYPPPNQSQPLLQPASPLLAPSPYTELTDGLTERRESASRPASPVRTGRRVPRPRLPPVPSTHAMALCPSSVPLRVPLPPPRGSSLPAVPDPESGRTCAASPTVARLLATVITDPSFESTAASALVAELVDFVATCRLDYATALIAESASASPLSVGGECALGTDVLEDRQEDIECLAAAVPRFASMPLRETRMHQTSRPRALTQRRLRILTPLSGRQPWMPRWHPGSPQAPTVNRPPGSPPAFKARYVARGFSQRQGVDYFQTFSPTPKMTTLRVLLHVAAQRDYELHSLDFSTAFLQGSLHKEIWLRRPPGFTGSFPAGTQWSLRRPVYGLRQAPREWHDTLRTTLAALGCAPSTADPSLFLHTDTSLLAFYVLVYVDDLVFATADTEALNLVKSELQKRHTCTDLVPLSSSPT